MPLKQDYYVRFKEELISSAMILTSSDLLSLVGEYADVINSNRRRSCITSCSELISLLEKRDHINADNITPLKNIINRLPQPERDNMMARLVPSRERPVPLTSFNQYAQPIQAPLYSYGVLESPNATRRHSYEKHPGILPDRVVDLISSEIGRKWKDLARKLKLREGDINSIQSRHANVNNDTVQCVQEVLYLYQSRSERHELERNLLTALEKARRVDLRNSVQKLLERRDS